MKRLNIILFLLMLLPLSAFTQEYRITRFTEEEGLMETEVFHAVQDSMGLIWMASRDGLLRYDGSSFKTFKAYAGDNCPLKANSIGYIMLKGKNILCEQDGEAFLFNTVTEKFSSTTEKIISDKYHTKEYPVWQERVKALKEYKGIKKIKVRLVDHQGGVWVRTTRGLERIEYTDRRYKPVKVSQEPEEEVRAMLCDADKRTWMADKNGYVRIMESGAAKYLAPDGTLSEKRRAFGKRVYCMFQDSKGRIWIGCKPGGLYRLSPKGSAYSIVWFEKGKGRYAINNDAIYDVKEDSRGRIWIATYGGGVNVAEEGDDGTVRFWNADNAFRTYPDRCRYIHGLDITDNGVLLLATTDGLLTANIGEELRKMHFYVNRRRMADSLSMSTSYLYDVKMVNGGRVAVATNGGGICYSDDKNLLSEKITFNTIDSRKGMASDVFLTMVQDKKGNIWAVGKNSLSQIMPTGHIENYMRGRFEGLFQFSEAEPMLFDDGRITFGTSQGYITVHPDSLKKSTYAPKIVCYCPDTIQLSSDEKSVLINFAAIDFNNNERIVYAYKLEGIDSEWQYTRDSHVYYGNLPGGEFRLFIRSTNSDGVWADNSRYVTIIRRPAFNETHMAWMLYGVLSVALLLIVWRTMKYIRKLKREMSAYELKTKEQLQYMTNRIRELMSGHSNIINVEECKEEDSIPFAERAKCFVRENIGNADVTVDDFARYMNMSASLLYLKCKENLGFTPNSFMQNVRINMAANILEQTGEKANISDVAYRCGFSDPKYFSRCFKKHKGVSPKEYAKGGGQVADI